MKTVEEIVKNLPKYVFVTGSWARGEQTEDSDYDFYVPENKWDEFKKWSEVNMTGERSSAIMGALSWRVPELIEFSCIFRKQKNKLPLVTLFGREFKTR